MKDRDVNFFRPMWRRVAVTSVCVIWACLEVWGRDPTWIAITVGLSAYAIWQFFIRFPKEAVAASGPAAEKGKPDVPPQA